MAARRQGGRQVLLSQDVGVCMIKQVEDAAQRGLFVLRLLKPPSGTALVAAQLP
jgi:hypothetical protein